MIETFFKDYWEVIVIIMGILAAGFCTALKVIYAMIISKCKEITDMQERLEGRVTETESSISLLKDTSNKLDRLTTAVNNMHLGITTRLTRIETKLNIPVPIPDGD